MWIGLCLYVMSPSLVSSFPTSELTRVNIVIKSYLKLQKHIYIISTCFKDKYGICNYNRRCQSLVKILLFWLYNRLTLSIHNERRARNVLCTLIKT